MSNTIFIQMAAYRDPQLIPTLQDMFKNAEHPENLHVGICWQHGEESTLDMFIDGGFSVTGFTEVDERVYGSTVELTTVDLETKEEITETRTGAPTIHLEHASGGKLTVIDLHYHKTQGACWARHQIQQLFSGEKYTMQLDSHHRFVDKWDTVSIDMLEDLRTKGYKKPLLTAYIPSFDPENDPAGRDMNPWKMNFDRFIPEGAVFFMPAAINNWKDLDTPVPARFFSAHFAFADGHFAEVVQHDPEYFFHGEEISIAVRAYTHGYDIFHPHRLIAWHEYTRKGRVKVWDDHDTSTKNRGRISLDWVERNNLCHKRNRILFGMDGEDPNQIDFGKFGFGTERTLRDYEEFSGLSFKYRGITQDVVDKIDPPGSVKFENEEQWKSSFVRSNDVRILIHNTDDLKYEDGTVPDDFDFWYVGAANEDLSEITASRRDATESEIKERMNGTYSDFRLMWFGNDRPYHYIVWPHSKSRGWRHERIVKKVEEY